MRKGLYIGYKGRLEAYIYIWFSKNNALVYVGETKNINGVIGRANQHVSHDSGTLYSRLYDKGYDLDDIDDFILLSINEQILKFAQNYPTNFKTALSDAPFFINWCRLPIRSVLT